MSTPGWYPDPGGRPGHYRLWDGQGWGLSTTPDPPRGPSGGPPPPRRRRVAPWVVAAAGLALVLAVLTALVVRDERPDARAPSSGPSVRPAPAVTPSPTPSPSAESPSPGDTPSPEPCPVGNPFARQDYPRDGRVHGGSLSFPQQTGWDDPGQQTSAFTWAYDVGQTDLPVGPRWFASYAVGAVSVADGFEDPESATELIMRCTLASSLYFDVTSRTDLVSEETTVDGYPAWTLRTEVRADDDRATTEGDTVQITVVDLDSPEALAFFWGCAPLGDAALTAQLDQVVGQLRVG